MIPVSRSDYAKAFDYYRPRMLFVESAWNGNSGNWQYQFVGSSGPRERALDMLRSARDRGIPTVFWNKEDPPHFDEFLPFAQHFDYIFTTEGALVGAYREAAPQAQVGVLPFAAQPRIHHPIHQHPTARGEVAFAGQYFRDKFPERREQMDYLFAAAAGFDFKIYSREVGSKSSYAFPEPYEKFIVGSLPYDMMLDAYRSFRVFLNVNSVPNSETMCARRVFELSACKTSVLSAPTPAIEAFYATDEVFMAADVSEARDMLKVLLGDEEYRRRSAHRAWRRTLTHNTYSSRFAQVFETVGVERRSPQAETIRVIAVIDNEQQARRVVSDLDQQKLVPKEVILVSRHSELSRQWLEEARPWRQRTLIGSELGALQEPLGVADSCDPWIVIDGSHRYAPHFLGDLTLAWNHYSHYGVIAKPLLAGQSPDCEASVVSPVGLMTDKLEMLRDAVSHLLLEGRSSGLETAQPAVLIDDFNVARAALTSNADRWQV